jgi:ADP-ribosylglycohydrolase
MMASEKARFKRFLYSIDRVSEEAKRSGWVAHNHPEGIKGTQATALVICMARKGEDKESIRLNISDRFDWIPSLRANSDRKIRLESARPKGEACRKSSYWQAVPAEMFSLP